MLRLYKWTVRFLLSAFSFCVPHAGQAQASTAIVSTHSATLEIPVKSWKALRDAQVVKQDLDFSCGSAALATLLNHFYSQTLTEELLLKAMDKGDSRASFDDMTRALPLFGFKAEGFAANWDQLTRLKIPVIVYLKHRKSDTFFCVARNQQGHCITRRSEYGQPNIQPTTIFDHVANAARHTKRRLIREVFGGLAYACRYQGDRQFFHQNTLETNHRRHAVARYALAAQLSFQGLIKCQIGMLTGVRLGLARHSGLRRESLGHTH